MKEIIEIMIEVNLNDSLQCHDVGWISKLETKKLKMIRKSFHKSRHKKLKETKTIKILANNEEERKLNDILYWNSPHSILTFDLNIFC